jgi:hypothetical protein
MDEKEIKDALMDMELFKPDDIFYERVASALYLMLQPVNGDPEIKNSIRGVITQYLLDAKLITNEQIPRGK